VLRQIGGWFLVVAGVLVILAGVIAIAASHDPTTPPHKFWSTRP